MKSFRKFIGLFYILALFFVIPYYHKGTFDGLSQHKVEAFYLVAGISFVAYFVFSIFNDIRGKKTKEPEQEKPVVKNGISAHQINISFLDVSLFLFLTVNIISTLLSGRIKDAFYGIPGFGMGLLSIIIMVISYFYISRNVKLTEEVIHLIAISSIFAVLLAILNRFGYDPLNMFNDGEDLTNHLYVSTFGNYSAFSSYLSIIIPIVFYMAVFAKNFKIRLCYIALFILDVIAVFMAGTDTILYVTVFVVVIVLIWKFAPRVRINRELITAAFVVVALSYGAFVSFATADPDFGNGRSFIWGMSLDLFRSFQMKGKLFGVGPNCYMYALEDFLKDQYVYLSAYGDRFGSLKLTSAHSEYLDYLVNTGLAGLFSYILVIYAAFRKYTEKEEIGMLSKLSMLCVVSYLFLVMMNFSNVLATPFFFILLGTMTNE